MKTPSHLAIAYLLSRCPRAQALPARWLLAGAVLPDLPLMVVWTVLALGTDDPVTLRAAMDAVYFHDPAFLGLHHLLHSPVSVALLGFAAWQGQMWGLTGGRCLAALCLGAASHIAADLGTHAEDGALWLWPLDWVWRAEIGVSQWDGGRAAILMLAVELALCLVALAVRLGWIGRAGAHPGGMAQARSE